MIAVVTLVGGALAVSVLVNVWLWCDLRNAQGLLRQADEEIDLWRGTALNAVEAMNEYRQRTERMATELATVRQLYIRRTQECLIAGFAAIRLGGN